MIRNKIMVFVCAFCIGSVHAETVDYIDMQLDAQINELISRRDKLKSDLESCEKNTRGYKIAGISTLTATGVGVVGNIKLAQEIEKQKLLKGKGGGYVGGGSGAGGPKADTRTEEQKASAECQMFCADMPEDARELGCEC